MYATDLITLGPSILDSTHHAVTIAGAENPIKDITWNLDLLGGSFKSKLLKIGGFIWAVVMLITALILVTGFLSWAAARRDGRDEEVTKGAGKAKIATICLAAEAFAIPLVGGIVAIAS